MKIMQVFDCQHMPQALRRAFFDLTQDRVGGNDFHIRWDVGECDFTPENSTDFIYGIAEDKVYREVDLWLKQDAKGIPLDNEVLIKRWW